MPSERNRSDLPREYSFHRDLIQDSDRLRDRIPASRDDEPLFNEEKILRENYATSDMVAKFALVTSAASLLSKRPLGKLGMEIAGKLTNMLNKGQRTASKAYSRYAAEVGDVTSQINANASDALRIGSGDTPLIAHLKIFEDLDTNLDNLNRLDLDGSLWKATGPDATLSDSAKHIANQMRDSLRERYSRQFNSSEGIEDLTVDKLLAMSTDNIQREKIVDLFGKKQIDQLEDMKRIGLLHGEQRLDERLFLDTAAKEIIDTRVLSGQYLGGMIERSLSQFQLPFVNLKFTDIFAAPMKHLLGKGEASGIVRAPDAAETTARRLVIGEDLFRIIPKKEAADGAFGLEHLASGYRARSTDKIGEAVIARRGQLRSQVRQTREDIEATSSNPLVHLAHAVMEDAGIGRRYATQESLLWQATTNVVKRRTRGTPVLKETTELDEVTEEIVRRTGTSKVDYSELNAVERSIQRVQRESKPDIEHEKLGFFPKKRREVLAALGDESRIQYLQKNRQTGKMEPVVKPVRGTSEADFGLRQASVTEKIKKNIVDVAPDQSEHKKWLPMESFTYESDLGSRLLDTANFMTTRLNDLIGATMGIGFRPTPGMYGFAGNTTKIFGMAAGGVLALEGLKYADYLTGVPTGGYKASNLILDTYGAAKISAQFLREFTGLSPAARYMEDLMPGSIESSASDFVRTLAPFIIALKTAPTKANILLATGISAFAGEMPFPGITETPEETIDILSGEQQVPMRSGRYWMLGKQPFGGGRVSYFAPGMFARMRSEYKYTDTLYGSQAEYFKNVSFLPTPSNMFRIPELVGNVLSPVTNLPFVGSLIEHAPVIGAMFDPQGAEFLAEKHRFDRPYPTAFGIEQLANRTIGKMGVPGGNSPGVRSYQTPGESVIEMGMDPYPTRSEMSFAVKKPTLSSGLAHMSELSGIYKFALWDLGLKTSAPTSPELADPGFMSSITRSFYDESVGGLMGHTELLRRFVMVDYLKAQRQAANTIPNTMPSWLPGSRSNFTGKTAMGVFPGDTNYHIDFSTGDPYAKIPHGELRLPGTAREIAFRLHSGSPGIYDAVDRFMVLSDVAPHSEAYKHYKILVDSLLKSGTVDEYWTNKITKTNEGVKQKLERYQTYSRKFNSVKPQLTTILDQAKNEENQEGMRTYYTMPEQMIGSAWEVFSHDIVARAGITVPILGPLLSNKLLPIRDELEGYLKREVYDTDEYDWAKPYSTILRPMAEQLKATDPFTATMGGFITGTLMGANPVAKVVMSTAGAMYFGSSSAMRGISTGKLTGGYIPGYVTERRRADEYFDNLEYLKMRRLENKAKSEGIHDLANHFIDLKGRTVASLDFSLGAKQFVRNSLIALPTREKQLFMSSMDASTSRRKQILEYVPEYLKPVYRAAWAKQGDNAFDYSNVRKAPDARLAEYFAGHGMPDPTWAGFHPDVPMDAVRVKTMDSVWGSVSNDLHRSGVFGNVAAKLRTEFPSPDLSVFNFYNRSGLDAAARQQLEAELMQSGLTDYTIDENLGSGLENIVHYDMSSRSGLENFFAIATDILRS
jgi:hypothetical protein